MHNRVSFKVAQKFAAVRKAVRRFRFAQDNSCFCGCDAEWVFSRFEAVCEARASVR
jgi:hypothetical protein